MSKINITFKGKNYSIDQALLAGALSSLEDNLVKLENAVAQFIFGQKIKDGSVTYVYEGMANKEEFRTFLISYLEESGGTPWEQLLEMFQGDEELLLQTSFTELFGGPMEEGLPFPSQWNIADADTSINGICQIPAYISGFPVVTTSSAFRYCKNLTGLIIPNTIQNLCESFVSDCPNLTTIEYDGTIEQWNAIEKDSDWISYTMVEYIQCSDGKVDLKGNIIPEGEPEILGSATFDDGVTLTWDELILEENASKYGYTSYLGPTYISEAAFANNESLISVTIPASVTEIGNGAFAVCPNLTSIIYTGSVAQWANVYLGESWTEESPVTYVQCSDGQVAL